jgi:hypothetical protein
MAITHIKIHPAIGVARVGNSPDEFFIGLSGLGNVPTRRAGSKTGSAESSGKPHASGSSRTTMITPCRRSQTPWLKSPARSIW